MSSCKTIRPCVAKLDANDNGPGLTRRSYLNGTLLILTFAALQLFGANAWALPTVTTYSHFTDHLAPSPIPSFVAGDKLQLTVFLDSSDPVGSPTISVQAIQAGTTATLDYYGLNKLLPGVHNYTKFIDFDPGLTGFWEIIPTDSTGTGPSTFTNAIVDPELLPFVEGVTLQGTPLGSRVAWMLPNLDGFDVDGIVVGIVEAPSGSQVWQSNFLSVQATSLDIPVGVLQVGVDYVYGIILADLEGGRAENVSRAFSQSFRYTIAGDFNADGTVDAADYVVWRKGLGTTYSQNDYGVWRAHFGASLGVGSGSALPSAEPLSAAVPEPANALLLSSWAAVVALSRRRVASRVPSTC